MRQNRGGRHFIKRKGRKREKILRKACECKKIKIIVAEERPEHVRMLLEILPKYSVLNFMGTIREEAV